MEVYVSTINFWKPERKKLSDIMPIMMDAGINKIEISSIHPYEKGIEDNIRAWSDSARLLIHNFAPPSPEDFVLNLSSQSEKTRKMSVDFIKQRIALTKSLGIDYYSFHAGFCVDYEFDRTEYTNILGQREALDLFISELREIVAYSESQNVHIGVENHVSTEETKHLLMLYDAVDFNYLFEEMASDYLHLHLDLGHLNVSANTHGFSREEFIHQFSDKVLAIHAHDNAGVSDTHLPFTEDSWFIPHLTELKNLKYLIIETGAAGDLALISQMIENIQKSIDC